MSHVWSRGYNILKDFGFFIGFFEDYIVAW